MTEMNKSHTLMMIRINNFMMIPDKMFHCEVKIITN